MVSCISMVPITMVSVLIAMPAFLALSAPPITRWQHEDRLYIKPCRLRLSDDPSSIVFVKTQVTASSDNSYSNAHWKTFYILFFFFKENGLHHHLKGSQIKPVPGYSDTEDVKAFWCPEGSVGDASFNHCGARDSKQSGVCSALAGVPS